MKSKILTMLLSVAIALVLWGYVVTYEYTQIEHTFPNVEVQLIGESTLNDRGLMIASDSEYMVDLTVYGKRSDISRLRSSDITVTVGLGSIYEAGERELSYEVSFPGDIRNGAIEIVKRKPDTVKINIARKLEKDIPVTPEIQGQVPEGYLIDMDDIKLSHQTIHLSGPEEWLNKIKKAKVLVDMANRTESYADQARVVLCDDDGKPIEGDMKAVTVSNSMINVEIPVLKRKQIQLELSIKPPVGLTVKDVEHDMLESITVVGSKSVIDSLPNSVPLDEIDLSQESSGKIIKEYSIPLNGNFTIEGDLGLKGFVTFTVPEMKTEDYDIPLSQIEIIGVPDDYTASATSKVTVTIRYKAVLEGAIDYSDLHAIVDAKGATNPSWCPVTVTVEDGSAIGVLEADASIYISIDPDT